MVMTRDDGTPMAGSRGPSFAVGSEQQEVEDARRRFVLALRMLTVRKENNAKAEAMLAKWREELARDIERNRAKRRSHLFRKWVQRAIFTFFLLCWLLKLPYWSWWMWVVMFFIGAEEVVGGKWKDTTTALARARDPRALGVLAHAMKAGDKDTREAAARGLMSILPALRASDRELIDGDAMAALVGLLAWGEGLSAGTSSDDIDMKLAVLKAMEQVGDSRAIPAVRKLLTPPRFAGAALGMVDRFFHAGAGAKLEAVRQAAEQCLPYLEQRAEAERMRDRLLRPAAAPTNAADILLRPAGGTPNTPEELLLRPVEGAEG